MKWIIGFLITILSFSYAHATVYEWVDRQGIIHFTDNPDKVPARYRAKIRARETVNTTEGTSPAASYKTPPRPVPLEKEVELPGGHDEVWWRTRFSSLRAELKSIQERLLDERDALTKLHRRWVISKGRTPKQGERLDDVNNYVNNSALSTVAKHRAAYYDMKAEIEREEARIKGIEELLAVLDVEANKAGVPSEWRK